MHYLPEIAIVNNIEFDHADIYQRSCGGQAGLSPVDESRSGKRQTDCRLGQSACARGCGLDGSEAFHPTRNLRHQLKTRSGELVDTDFSGETSKFTVTREGQEWGRFETPLIGEFNLLNCLAVIIAADAWGISRDAIADALATFQERAPSR